jgi:CheY-like chemotaxis protein
MTKRLLLVDDEKLFLKSLQEGLAPLSNLFETDICFSVNEAIKKIVIRPYDLIITDIRMPGKSGTDLLIYLKDAKFQGKIMVMSAYNTDTNSREIRSFGSVEVISKPFSLEWFKNRLVDIFNEKHHNKEKIVTFESLDLETVMQIINMERKTAVLEITVEDGKGHIYFKGGEIIHATYQNLEGEPAIAKLIACREGCSIAVKDSRNQQIKRTIQIPFVEQIMNIMKTIDELKRDIPSIPVETLKLKKNYKEVPMGINEKLTMLKDVSGYLGAGVFTPQGEMLEGTADISGIQFVEAGSLIHDTLRDAKDMSKKIGFGNLDLIQLYTELGIVFAKCYNQGNLHFHTILVIKNDGNIAMARLKLNKAVESLISEF